MGVEEHLYDFKHPLIRTRRTFRVKIMKVVRSYRLSDGR